MGNFWFQFQLLFWATHESGPVPVRTRWTCIRRDSQSAHVRLYHKGDCNSIKIEEIIGQYGWNVHKVRYRAEGIPYDTVRPVQTHTGADLCVPLFGDQTLLKLFPFFSQIRFVRERP